MEKIVFDGEDGEKLELFVIDSTKLAGKDYILAADAEVGDGSCYILRDVSDSESSDAVYEMVEDDNELDYLLSVFAEQMDDIDLEY